MAGVLDTDEEIFFRGVIETSVLAVASAGNGGSEDRVLRCEVQADATFQANGIGFEGAFGDEDGTASSFRRGVNRGVDGSLIFERGASGDGAIRHDIEEGCLRLRQYGDTASGGEFDLRVGRGLRDGQTTGENPDGQVAPCKQRS